MNTMTKVIIILLVVLYVLSPDLLPGPIDDAIVALIGVAGMKYLPVRKS